MSVYSDSLCDDSHGDELIISFVPIIYQIQFGIDSCAAIINSFFFGSSYCLKTVRQIGNQFGQDIPDKSDFDKMLNELCPFSCESCNSI